MSVKKDVKLSMAEEYYIKSNTSQTAKELAEALEKPIKLVEAFINTLPKPSIHVINKEKTRMENLYGNNGKGAIVSTEGASQYADATRKPAVPNNTSYIMNIK